MAADTAGTGNPADFSLGVLGGRPLGPQDPVMVGHYRIHAVLGNGGMGRVYLGRAQQPGSAPGGSGAWVAVKVIRPDLADNPEFRRRFARELEAVGLVRTPYAAALVHGDPGAQQPWMATEFVPGVALADAVRPGDPLPVSSVWRLAHDLGIALSDVHQAGIVHRDVKPSNVILGADAAKIIDFGVAHAPDLSRLTATGTNIGTPSYMAPEQAKAGETSPASDVFSLGVLLFFAATGRLPFGEGGTAEVLFRVVYEEPDLGGLEGLEPALQDLILRCIAKDPLHRPNAAGVVVLAENAAAAGLWNAQEAAVWPEGLAARISERTHAARRTLPDPPPAPLAEAASTVYIGASPDTGTRRNGSKRRSVLVASISAAVVIGLGAGAYAVFSPGSQSSSNAVSSGATGHGAIGTGASEAAAPGAGGAATSPSSGVSDAASAPVSASASKTARVTASAGGSPSASSGSGNTIGAGGVVTSSAPVGQPTTRQPAASVVIQGVYSGLCLSVTGASTGAGATADLYNCNGSVSENWTINSDGTITGKNSGMCLGVSGDSTTLKSTADINTCDGDSFEHWSVRSGGTIVNGDGECLSVTGASTSLYATANLYTCNGSPSENWTVR